jgi:multiple sugar transport system ATP-binding protein
MASIELENISKSFGKISVVHGVTLSVADKELLVFVGPSGCGKSTLLRMIAGLEEISHGTLRIGGKPMNNVPAADRGIAMVFQSYALYPHMSVAENMGFALKMMGVPKAEVEAKVARAAGILQLEHLLDRKPRQLSGGQRQRVAIGRAITRSPDVFLFDEPLSNLDADLRAQMRVEIARLHTELQTTMVYVTHDQVEAMTLADRIVILRDGRIEQVGSPMDLYQNPANRFVAGFLGQPKMNFIPVTSEEGTLRLAPTGVAILDRNAPNAVEIGVRPNAIRITENGRAAAKIILVEQLGGSSLAHLQPEGTDLMITVELPGASSYAPGTFVRFDIDPEQAHIFDAQGLTLR